MQLCCPGTHFADQASLKLSELHLLPSVKIKAYTTLPSLGFHLRVLSCLIAQAGSGPDFGLVSTCRTGSSDFFCTGRCVLSGQGTIRLSVNLVSTL